MADIEHNILTGTDLHEPKALAGASEDQVLTRKGATATWIDPDKLVGIKDLPIFVGTADVIVANTVTETSLVGVGQGSLVLAANTIAVGGFIEAEVQGIISATANPTIRFRVKANGIAILDTGAIVISGVTNDHFIAKISAATRAIGIAGKIMVAGSFVTSQGDHFPMVRTGPSPDEITIDTTADVTLDFSVEWGTADVGNTITTQLIRVERG